MLSSREKDVNEELRRAAIGKKAKSEVENWLKNVRHKETEVQDVERKAEKKRYLLRARFLRLVDKKIQVVTELIEQGRFPEGLLIDVHDQNGKLLQTPALVGETTAKRNLKFLLECLMNDEIRSIGVYGMRGVGKTTIVTHIHNQLLEDPRFTYRVYWVTVSQESSIYKLQNDIANHIKLCFSNEDDERRRPSELLNALRGLEKFVFILDDMWKEFLREKIGIPIGVDEGKLIITTQLLEVCRRMMCQQIIKVEPLSLDEACDLFMKNLGRDRVLDEEVEESAKSIAKECAGLPLAIIATARGMRGVDDIHDWRNALDELTEPVNGLIEMEEEVFKLLKFSYDRLKDEKLQKCLLYSAFFPEDHEFLMVDLIVYWIVEGLIDKRRTRRAEYDWGYAKLNKLKNVSLLESDQLKGCVKMHDVIRDMALNITRQNGPALCMVKAGTGLLEIPDERDWSENLERVSLMYNKIYELSSSISPECPRLCTLLFQGNHNITEIPNSFFVHMQSLQVLDLSHSRELKRLPDSISNLKSLRGLLLGHCRNLEYVPSLAELKELRELDLQSSGVIAVPEGLEELVNLKRLDLFNASRIQAIPTGLLPKISHLQCLRLDHCIQVDNVQTEELISLKQLEMLGMHFCDLRKFNSYVNSQHWQSLSHYCLQIDNQSSPVWQILSHYLLHIVNQSLWGSGMLSCKEVRVEDFNLNAGEGQDHSIVLPSNMQMLLIWRCHLPTSLLDLSPSLKNNAATRDLGSFFIIDCAGIEHLWSFTAADTTSIPQNLKILVLNTLPNLTSLIKCNGVGIRGGPPPHPESGNFSSLKQLSVEDCPNLKYLFTPLLVQHHLQNLQLIRVCYCREMEHIIRDDEEEKEENSIITLPKLQKLDLESLPKLKSMCIGTKTMVCPSLEEIRVFNCSMLKRLPRSSMPTRLKNIYGEKEWWDLLEWDTPEAKSILQPLFSEKVCFQRSDPIFNTYSDAATLFDEMVCTVLEMISFHLLPNATLFL